MIYRNNAGKLGSDFMRLSVFWATRCLLGGFYVPERPCIKENGKINKEKNQWTRQHRKLICIPGAWRNRTNPCCMFMDVCFCSISLLSVYMCVYTLKFKVHCGSVFESGASGFPSTLPVCVPNWRLCGDETTSKNGNLGDSEKSNLIKLKVCDKDFRKKI